MFPDEHEECRILEMEETNIRLTASVAELEERIRQGIAGCEAIKEERDGWHGVVSECERIAAAADTAESSTMSNLPNIVRDMSARVAELEEAMRAIERRLTGEDGIDDDEDWEAEAVTLRRVGEIVRRALAGRKEE